MEEVAVTGEEEKEEEPEMAAEAKVEVEAAAEEELVWGQGKTCKRRVAARASTRVGVQPTS